MLLASVVTPVIADQPIKSGPAASGLIGQIKSRVSPTATQGATVQPLTNGSAGNHNSSNNGSALGKLKIGNLHTPPSQAGFNISKQALKNNSLNDNRLKIAKTVADVKIGIVIKELELYKKKISASRLSDAEKAALIASADANIAWFNQQESDIQEAGDMATLQAMVNEADQQTAMMRVNLKTGAGLIVCDELDVKISTARNVSGIAAQKINDLKAKGYDTTQAEKALADYNVHVDAASQNSAAARAAFNGITGTGNMDSGFKEGLKQVSLAEQELGKSFSDLKDIYLLILRGNISKK